MPLTDEGGPNFARVCIYASRWHPRPIRPNHRRARGHSTRQPLHVLAQAYHYAREHSRIHINTPWVLARRYRFLLLTHLPTVAEHLPASNPGYPQSPAYPLVLTSTRKPILLTAHSIPTTLPPLAMARPSVSKAACVFAMVAVVASAAAGTPHSYLFPTAAELRGKFDDADFVIDTNKIRGAPNEAGNVRAGNQGTFQVLGLPDVDTSFAIVSLKENAHNLPHTHPRASETLFLTKGSLEVFIVEENGPSPARVIENTIHPGGLAVFPKGLIHGQRCVARNGCEAVAVLGKGDPGTVTVSARLCDAPIEAVAAAMGVPEKAAKRVCDMISGNPAAGQPAKDKHRY